MTNLDNEPTAVNSTAARRHEIFRQAMVDLGIQEFHGVELLRLVKMTANAYDMITAERMRVENLSAPRWRILLRLWGEERCGVQSLSPTQLSQAQRLSKNTVSAHLRSLEEQGFIERALDTEDLRQFQIRLSQKGRDLVRDSTPGHMAFLNELAGDLSPQEIELLQELLQKLHRSLVDRSGLDSCANGSPSTA
jgi:MarR family transcriptional regulator, organic hydroperoxide resistance regulator